MDRKRELKQLYKETKTHAGVYQIRNIKNGNRYIGSSRNVDTFNGKKFELKMGTYKNKELQNEWNTYGENCFVFEVLEILNKEENPSQYSDEKDALRKLEAKWRLNLQGSEFHEEIIYETPSD